VCDVLAIPGVSIAVEHLFSSSKHTISGSQSSMVAVTVSATVVAKELLKAGFGEGRGYYDPLNTIKFDYVSNTLHCNILTIIFGLVG
jgi:uncharacterized protein (DUF427 family)